MPPCIRRTAVAALVVGLAAVTGCARGLPTETRPIAWKTAEHLGGDGKDYIRVTEFRGPPGAALGKVLPGTYVVKGTYDLRDSSLDHGRLDFGFVGSYTPGEQHNVLTIPKGRRQGDFELRLVIEQFEKGEGTPSITLDEGRDFSLRDMVLLR